MTTTHFTPRVAVTAAKPMPVLLRRAFDDDAAPPEFARRLGLVEDI